jgi:hypothetical protein
MTPGTPAPDLIRGLRQHREAPDQVRGGQPDQVRGGVASAKRNVKAILTRPCNPVKSLTTESCPPWTFP